MESKVELCSGYFVYRFIDQLGICGAHWGGLMQRNLCRLKGPVGLSFLFRVDIRRILEWLEFLMCKIT